jgi:indole-3-glycerol phosphate synthase
MSFLDEILVSTRARVDDLKRKVTPEVLEARIASRPPSRDFTRSLSQGSPSVIAEIKRASPAKGDIDRNLNAGDLARSYAMGGAAAISVLTEPDFFHGSLEDLEAAGSARLPLLRKDFLLEDLQLLESRAAGADAVLLIARVLGDRLKNMYEGARALGMQSLVEIYDERDARWAVDCGASVVGINHRDLETFDVDLDRTRRLIPFLPSDTLIVSLSGVASRAEVDELAQQGAHAVLVGESLVRASDPAAKLRELTGV